MGFLKSLKEDISEAVNELITENILDGQEEQELPPQEETPAEEVPEKRRSSLSDFLYEDEFDGDVDAELDALVASIEARKVLEQQEAEEEAQDVQEAEQDYSLEDIDESKLSIKDVLAGKIPSPQELEERKRKEEERRKVGQFLKQHFQTGQAVTAKADSAAMAAGEKPIEGGETEAGNAAGKSSAAGEKTSGEAVGKSNPAGEKTFGNGAQKVLTGAPEKAIKLPEKLSEETTVLPKTFLMKGCIISNENLEIHGTVEGDIYAAGKVKIAGDITGNVYAEEIIAEASGLTCNLHAVKSVKVMPQTLLRGNIHAKNAAVSGRVIGSIEAKGTVELDGEAVVEGDVRSVFLLKNPGAEVTGECVQYEQ